MNLDINLIRASVETLKPIAPMVATFFCETLFANHPEISPLFNNKNDLERQKKALIQSLVRIVDGLNDIPSLKTYLQGVGAHHATHLVREEYYEMGCKSFIATLRYFFKEKWNAHLEDQWILLISFIADNLLQGALKAANGSSKPDFQSIQQVETSHRKSEQDLSQTVRQIARDVLMKALMEEMDGEFMKVARKKAANILTQAIRDEAEQLQTKLSSDSPKKKAA